jgi:hypothetical protein
MTMWATRPQHLVAVGIIVLLVVVVILVGVLS